MADMEKLIEDVIKGTTKVLETFGAILETFETAEDEEDEVYQGMSDEWDSPQQCFASMRHLIDEVEARHQADVSTMARLSSQNEQQAKEISRLLAEVERLKPTD